MLEIRHLQSLIALAETGNLTRAGQRVSLSQSALSHQVRTLEEHYGLELFERKTSPLKWTRAGERLLVLAYDVQRQIADAERDLSRFEQGVAGTLRIAVECHSCFDWLMPAMDALREGWPGVEMDIVSGFHADPVGLLDENRADLVIVSSAKRRRGIEHHPLFEYDMPALLAHDHPLLRKSHLTARDFERETLITYPIPDNRMDLFRQVLEPAGIGPKERRTTELTVAILQLVKSRRGIAALPRWAVQAYLDRDYVAERPIGTHGLRASLHAATTREGASQAFMREFIETVRRTAQKQFQSIRLL
ncbi:LysR family transcriptional regulator [Luteolibacter ambystomatis]|uniref:HTH-type transcriptional regulator MetR n=1 Tax=Luteolibacter ambystomatis TaxID=2824561 RepID=A0A975J171_9BACT|nr:LysR family transcriptional regulator [Luteolibacter ambystomatis]QUE52109.1 LysR family transcriptional regulator [Luteolibacter ambystomatis]